MCNELHYNAFRNNAVHIRQVREIPALQKMCSKNIKNLTVKKAEGKPNVVGLGQKIGFINHLNFVETPKKDETS